MGKAACPEMGVSVANLTEEQMAVLRGNRYIRSVSECVVFYTDEFKRLCWHMHSEENMMPKEILRRLGVDYHILGKPRVRGLFYELKKRYGCDAESGREAGVEQRIGIPGKRSEKQKIERLRAENEYLKQELEFVKKIVAAGGEAKR